MAEFVYVVNVTSPDSSHYSWLYRYEPDISIIIQKLMKIVGASDTFYYWYKEKTVVVTYPQEIIEN